MAANESRPGALTAEDEEYLRGQAGSVGSGALGGWSQSAFGGYLTDGPQRAVAEVRAELQRLRALAALAAPHEPTHPSGLDLAA